MKEITLPTPARSSPHTNSSLVDDWARRSVFATLNRLSSGQIIVDDDSGVHTLGRPGELAARIQVRHPAFYRRLAFGGELGAAETFIDGGWTADSLSTVLRIFARELGYARDVGNGWGFLRSLGDRILHALRRNTLRGSARNIHAHYDLGNAFFALFLDETMNYSSGIFESPSASMQEASVAKMERACRKLRLTETDHLLEIGTGWGALAIHAASKYGCRVTTTTISQEQYELASRRVREAGMEARVQVVREDYRNLTGQYDKLVSIEVIEAVGHKFLDTYFGQCGRLLKRDGLMLLQAIVTPEHRYEDSRRSVDFIRRYIFPGSCLTSVGTISASVGRVTDFRTLHVEDIGPHYAETLRRWRQRFFSNIERVRDLGYDDRFIRMWDYYLCYSEAGFEERVIGDVQMLFERPSSRRAAILGNLQIAGLQGGSSPS